MFTSPPALVVGSGVDEAVVVGVQLPLVVVGQAKGLSLLGVPPALDDDDPHAASPAATVTAATTAAPDLTRCVLTLSTEVLHSK
jgi:hypothetical protein